MLRTYEWNINPVDTTGLKLYLQAKNEIYKETEKLYISVSNDKDTIDHFLGLYKKYVWGRLVFMLGTTDYLKNIFRVVEQIHLADIQKQARGFFGMIGIENVGIADLPANLSVSPLIHLYDVTANQSKNIW